MGIHEASRPVTPKAAVTSTIAPASIAAPVSSPKDSRCPSEAKKINAKMLPVNSSGIRYRRVSTTAGIIGSP